MTVAVLLQNAGGAAWGSLLMPVVFLAIFYFIVFVPQQRQRRQHREMIQSLTAGDQVATLGGIVGQIVSLKDETVTLKTGDARVVVERSEIARKIAASGS